MFQVYLKPPPELAPIQKYQKQTSPQGANLTIYGMKKDHQKGALRLLNAQKYIAACKFRSRFCLSHPQNIDINYNPYPELNLGPECILDCKPVILPTCSI